MNYDELSRTAGNARKASDFRKALPLFEQLFEQYKDSCNQYDWWGYSQSLLKLDIYDRALEVSREGLLKFPEFVLLKTIYSWSLYYVVIQPEPVQDSDAFIKAATEIVSLAPNDSKYTPLVRTVFQVVDYYESDYDHNVQQILDWISKINPGMLDTKSFSYTDKQGRQMELASDLEKYYAVLSKARYEQGLYTDCIVTVNAAMDKILHFHHGNEVWLRRQRALSYYKLQQYQESLTDYQFILNRKQDWFLKKELAEVYLAMGDTEKALLTALDAADDDGDHKMKVNLFSLVARLFLSKGHTKEAAVHAKIVNCIREQEHWPVDQEAERILAECDQEGELTDDFKELSQSATAIWKQFQPEVNRCKGMISNILLRGNAGFIKGDDGGSYYFRTREFNDRNLKPEKGRRVSFIKADSIDPVRNQPSVIATDIRGIEETEN